MLETTFLGHQGWRFATAGATVLVDPLLVEPFGHNGGVGVVHPPRRLDVAAMGPVDAVILTHEHEDHFNIPSVNRISREIPFIVPERSSAAMRGFLAGAGFKVTPVAAGGTVEIADLQFTTFPADHVRHDEQDEWDTTPFLVMDAKDGGSFFSPVDIAVSAGVQAQLQRMGVTPGLFGYANNTMNMSSQERPPRRPPAVLPIAARFLMDHIQRPSPKLASLMCGGGFAFTGARAWMNHTFFPLDSSRLFQGLETMSGERFLAVTPGMQLVTDRNSIRSVLQSAPFLSTPPPEQWPDRTYNPATVPPDSVEPASGQTELRPGELRELEERLVDFAQFLYGGALFRAIHSLGASAPTVRMRSTFGICAMSGGADHVFEYDPAAGRFALLDRPAPMSEYAAGLECFASDLLEFLRGKLAPSALMFGRVVRWRNSAEATTVAIDQAIWMYGHPLRRQAEYAALYQAIYAAEPNDVARVPGRPRGG
jgi:L-ascorbate metabolism protein UlaG (beta-lactamase superfamily)